MGKRSAGPRLTMTDCAPMQQVKNSPAWQELALMTQTQPATPEVRLLLAARHHELPTATQEASSLTRASGISSADRGLILSLLQGQHDLFLTETTPIQKGLLPGLAPQFAKMISA